jgi:hypothetical protein
MRVLTMVVSESQSENKTNMKKTILILTAVASLTIAILHKKEEPHVEYTEAEVQAQVQEMLGLGCQYSTIFILSRMTHGWLYDYANYDPYFPGTLFMGLRIWPPFKISPSPWEHPPYRRSKVP